MPVIGCHDGDNFDILSIENLPIVLVNFWFVTLDLIDPVGTFFRMALIDIADRNTICVLQGTRSNAAPSAAGADTAQDREVFLGIVVCSS